MKNFSIELASDTYRELKDISYRFCFFNIVIWRCSLLGSANYYGLIDTYDL